MVGLPKFLCSSPRRSAVLRRAAYAPRRGFLSIPAPLGFSVGVVDRCGPTVVLLTCSQERARRARPVAGPFQRRSPRLAFAGGLLYGTARTRMPGEVRGFMGQGQLIDAGQVTAAL